MSSNKYTLTQLAAIYCVYKDLTKQHTINCCTCGKLLYIEQVEDCYAFYGHYLARSIYPKLKLHPKNTHAQCPACNLNFSTQIDNRYKKYMHYRYGDDIDDILKSEQDVFGDNNKTKNFYLEQLVFLTQKFPELYDVVLDTNTGELLDNYSIAYGSRNDIEKQWDTFSKTYKQDLDTLTHTLRTEPIEYERF